MASKGDKLKARLPRGLNDRSAAEIRATERMLATIRQVYERYGFEPVETPLIEYTDALGKFLPDQDRPNEGVFSFQDDDEQWLSLRYDLTAPLARYVAENWERLPKPYRSYRAGWVFRNEKPGPGRFRQFMQFDADTVGAASPAADAEMCMMAADTLEALGIPRGQYVIKVNSRKVLDGVMEAIGVSDERQKLAVLRAIDKLDRLGIEGVRQLLGPGRKDESGDFTKGAGLSSAGIETVLNVVDRDADEDDRIAAIDIALARSSVGQWGRDELDRISVAVRTAGYADQVLTDASVVRGLEYYTGAVFEAQLLGEGGMSFGSVGGGGRYDDLVARFRGERIPATGFSIGVSRLATALQAQSNAEPAGPVVVLVMDQARIGDALAMAGELRAAGVRAEAYLGGGGMKAQLKYADKRASPIAVIQGGDELAKGVVTLKDLKLGERLAQTLGEDREAYARARDQVQQEVPRDRLVTAVREILTRM